MLPSGEERPAGSRRTPVGKRAVLLRAEGVLDGGALAAFEAPEDREQLASSDDSAANTAAVNDETRARSRQ